MRTCGGSYRRVRDFSWIPFSAHHIYIHTYIGIFFYDQLKWRDNRMQLIIEWAGWCSLQLYTANIPVSLFLYLHLSLLSLSILSIFSISLLYLTLLSIPLPCLFSISLLCQSLLAIPLLSHSSVSPSTFVSLSSTSLSLALSLSFVCFIYQTDFPILSCHAHQARLTLRAHISKMLGLNKEFSVQDSAFMPHILWHLHMFTYLCFLKAF